ncbi:MAG: CotH kinase family protein, partial [Treponema sp.]|nr:CotH kinase family protein [Treponema sp.]
PDLTTLTYLFDGDSWTSGSKPTSTAGNTVTIRVSANTAGDDASRDYQVTVKRTTASGLPKITAFSFTQANNGDSLSAYTGDITGTLSQTNKTITITHNTSNVYRWIEGLNLKATFVADAGAKVYVKGVEQTSGASPVDFSGDVVYTAVSSDGFLRNDYTVLFQSPQLSGLPSVRVKTEDGKTINSREVYQKARIQIIDPANPAYNLDLPSDPYSYPDEIRGRGNTTWTDVGDYDYDKKNPYRIKFGSKKSLFGLTSAKSWVLLANKNDPTLIMNTVAFETARKIGLEFANHAIPVELYVNERYMGSYTLTEQVQVNPGRVDIDEDNGFLISMDTYNYNPPQYVDADPRFKAGANLQLPLMFKSPETDGLTGPLDLERDSTVPPHTTYQPFMAIMDSFVGALESTDSAVFPEQYRTYIDMDEFVDFIMINEMVRNTEVQHPKSFYFYRDAGTDAKIKMGPPWDFDWAFGGSGGNYFNETTKEGSVTIPRIMLYPNGKGPSPYNSVLPNSTGFKYFRRFFADPDFVARYKERWSTNKAKFGEIPAFIDGVSGNIAKSHAENVRRWGNNASGPTGTTFEAQMSNMKTWWNARVTYLNGQIAGW